LTVNLPISLIVLPVVQQRLGQKPGSEQEAHWYNEFRDKITSATQQGPELIKGYGWLLAKLQSELQQMREDFSSRAMEIPRSHTPTIGADMHSDSGSAQSVSTHRSGRPGTTGPLESRRMSSSTAFGKLRATAKAAAAVTSSPNTTTAIEIATGHNLHDATILEDIEDETTQMITGTIIIGKVGKSPSLPTGANRAIASNVQSRRSIGLGMFQSMRRKSKYEESQSGDPVELRELHRRTRSWNKRMTARGSTQSEDPILITPLTMPESQIRSNVDASTPTSKTSEYQQSLTSGSERPRMVSFSTPKDNGRDSQASDADSEEYCITARHHLI